MSRLQLLHHFLSAYSGPRSTSWRRRLHLFLLYGIAFLRRRIHFRTRVIAVVGSVGKTTTKELLAKACARHGPTLQTRENRNDLHGVPRTLLGLRPHQRFAVVEMGTEHKGMIAVLAFLVRPEVAVVLSVRRPHFSSFRTLDAKAREKSEVLRWMATRGTAVLNADDPRVREMGSLCRGTVLFFGTSNDVDLRVEEGTGDWPDRFSCRVRSSSYAGWIGTRLVGRHWHPAVSATLLAGQACGLETESVLAAIGRTEPFRGRLQPMNLPGGAVALRDETASDPDSLEAALEVPRTARARRRIVLLGDVSESRSSEHLTRVLFSQFGEVACRKDSCGKILLCDVCDELQPDPRLAAVLPGYLGSDVEVTER